MRDQTHYRRHFLTLDGLRGAAAISVALFHRRWVMPGEHLLDHAYLAVDFFFALSGFVISYAYQDALMTRMSGFGFIKARLIRLYPLIFLGGVIGGSVLIWEHSTNTHIVTSVFLNLFVIPSYTSYVSSGLSDVYFIVNPPLWSMFQELLISLIFLSALNYLSRPYIYIVVAMSAISLVCALIFFDLSGIGQHKYSFFAGPARTAFPFFVGVLIYQLYKDGMIYSVKMPKLAIYSILICTFLPNNDSFFSGNLYDLACVGIVYPLLIAAACNAAPASWCKTIENFAGQISYPLYILHLPVYELYNRTGLPLYRLSLALAIPAALVSSYVAFRLFDEPVRRWLTARFRSR